MENQFLGFNAFTNECIWKFRTMEQCNIFCIYLNSILHPWLLKPHPRFWVMTHWECGYAEWWRLNRMANVIVTSKPVKITTTRNVGSGWRWPFSKRLRSMEPTDMPLRRFGSGVVKTKLFQKLHVWTSIRVHGSVFLKLFKGLALL